MPENGRANGFVSSDDDLSPPLVSITSVRRDDDEKGEQLFPLSPKLFIKMFNQGYYDRTSWKYHKVVLFFSPKQYRKNLTRHRPNPILPRIEWRLPISWRLLSRVHPDSSTRQLRFKIWKRSTRRRQPLWEHGSITWSPFLIVSSRTAKKNIAMSTVHTVFIRLKNEKKNTLPDVLTIDGLCRKLHSFSVQQWNFCYTN